MVLQFAKDWRTIVKKWGESINNKFTPLEDLVLGDCSHLGKISPDEFAKTLCSDQLGPDLGRVGFKFIRDMLVGIERAQSVNLTAITNALCEGIRPHATHKRLSRNLDNPELSQNFSDRLLKLGAAQVGKDTRLIVHMYELNKKYARKVEYLPSVENGESSGFRVCGIVANDIGSQNYVPLLASVWSEDVPGYVSDTEEIKKVLYRVSDATGNRGMFYFDDKSVDDALLSPLLEEPSLNFVMWQRSDASVVYRNKTCSIQEVADSVETAYGKMMFKLVPKGVSGTSIDARIAGVEETALHSIASRNVTDLDFDLFVHAGVTAIKSTEAGTSHRLIALKTKNRLIGEVVVPLITSAEDLRSRKALMGLVDSCLTIQDTLQAHHTLLERFDPASFRVLTYSRLQFLMSLLQAVMYYEVSVAEKVSVEDHQISSNPHDGDLDRTYYLPDKESAL